jgi:osmotically-inducible protein OsmY
MKYISLMNKIFASAAIFGLAITVPIFAQDNTGDLSTLSASKSMHQAGESAEQAGSDTLHAVKHATKGTATAMRDTKITAKVKVALHEAGITENSKIHVSTTAGVVKLRGRVPSSETAVLAEQAAEQTEGVRGVTNDLRVARAADSD